MSEPNLRISASHRLDKSYGVALCFVGAVIIAGLSYASAMLSFYGYATMSVPSFLAVLMLGRAGFWVLSVVFLVQYFLIHHFHGVFRVVTVGLLVLSLFYSMMIALANLIIGYAQRGLSITILIYFQQACIVATLLLLASRMIRTENVRLSQQLNFALFCGLAWGLVPLIPEF